MAFILLSPDVREYLEKTPTPGLKGGGEVIVPRIENKVVVHFRDGRILKGYTYDFHPDKTVFHLIDAQNRKEVTEVSISQTKAVFFVKTFEGNRDHPGPDDFSMESFKNSPGLKVKVTFYDDEVMYGSTHGYAPNRKGFFLSHLPTGRSTTIVSLSSGIQPSRSKHGNGIGQVIPPRMGCQHQPSTQTRLAHRFIEIGGQDLLQCHRFKCTSVQSANSQ